METPLEPVNPNAVGNAFHIILAPLRGLTDAIFRTTWAEHFSGIDQAVAPFVVATAGRVSGRLLADLMPAANRAMPVVPQILGNDPEAFLAMAGRLADMGYTRINWNLGCPFPMVARKFRGSGLLPYPDRIRTFLDRVVTALPQALSVKTRLGRWDAGEIFALLPILDRYPLESIIIHPRTGAQMYEGRVDLETCRRCLAATRHPVVYNGDILTPHDFRRIANRFPGINRWMLGRGVLSDPLLPARIQGLALPRDPAASLGRFHDALLAAYERRLSGPGHLVDRMKGFWRYLSRSFVDGDRVWRRMRKVRDLAAYRRAAEAVFSDEALDDCGDT